MRPFYTPNTTSTTARTSSENVTSGFCNHFAIIYVIRLAKCFLTILELNRNKRFCDKNTNVNSLSSYSHVVHTTAKHVISRRGKNKNVFKMSKDEKCTCEACKNTVFHCQICKFETFLLPSSSWLLKLPNVRTTKATTVLNAGSLCKSAPPIYFM